MIDGRRTRHTPQRQWREIDLSDPPEGHAHDPVVLYSNGRRVGLAWCPAEAYWMIRCNAERYPRGTTIESLRRRTESGERVKFGRTMRAGEPLEVEA